MSYYPWSNKEGHGLGVIMNYVARDGSIWLTYKGKVTLHGDQKTKNWFYPAMAKIISPNPAPTAEAAMVYLDTLLRLIIAPLAVTQSLLWDKYAVLASGLEKNSKRR